MNEESQPQIQYFPPREKQLMTPELATAFIAAQAEFKDPERNLLNPHTNSKYADLTSVLKALRAPLTKNGVALVQPFTISGPIVSIETIIVHKSGASYSFGAFEIELSKCDAQSVGSAITYGRRYGAQLLGISAEPDDDANEASQASYNAWQSAHTKQNDYPDQPRQPRYQNNRAANNQPSRSQSQSQQPNAKDAQSREMLSGLIRAMNGDGRRYWAAEMEKHHKTHDIKALNPGEINHMISLIKRAYPDLKPQAKAPNATQQSAPTAQSAPAPQSARPAQAPPVQMPPAQTVESTQDYDENTDPFAADNMETAN